MPLAHMRVGAACTAAPTGSTPPLIAHLTTQGPGQAQNVGSKRTLTPTRASGRLKKACKVSLRDHHRLVVIASHQAYTITCNAHKQEMRSFRS